MQPLVQSTSTVYQEQWFMCFVNNWVVKGPWIWRFLLNITIVAAFVSTSPDFGKGIKLKYVHSPQGEQNGKSCPRLCASPLPLQRVPQRVDSPGSVWGVLEPGQSSQTVTVMSKLWATVASAQILHWIYSNCSLLLHKKCLWSFMQVLLKYFCHFCVWMFIMVKAHLIKTKYDALQREELMQFLCCFAHIVAVLPWLKQRNAFPNCRSIYLTFGGIFGTASYIFMALED